MDFSQKHCCPVGNFDPTGLIFVVAYVENVLGTSYTKICLYDVQNYHKGAFNTWKYDFGEIRILKFSLCGKQILCATADNLIVILDAFEGTKLHEFSDFINESSILEASFSPDSQFVFSGSENGSIHMWSVRTG